MSILVNNTTFPSLLDLFAPHSCRGCGRIGNALCDCCKNNIITTHTNLCPFCKTTISDCNCKKRLHFPPITAVSWRDSILDALVQDLKYHSVRSLARPLAEILDQTLPHAYSHLTIVPLPTADSHIRKRGLDHTLLIAKHLAKLRKTNITRLLVRDSSNTQVGSSRQKRFEQAKTAYQINPLISVKQDTTYLLLDDVWTTGASMTAAVKTLQDHQISRLAVAILALSR